MIHNEDDILEKDRTTGDEKTVTKRAEELLQIFKKGAEFTESLLKENEKLRYKIVRLEEENKILKRRLTEGGRGEELLRKIRELEREKEEILERFKEVEAENRDFAAKYVEIQEENNALANLYVASYQLHSTLDFREVLQIIMEIIINLIGAEIFAIFLLDEKTGMLTAVASEGVERDELPSIPLGKGVIGKAVRRGENYFAKNIIVSEPLELMNPIVVVPLRIKERIIGAIVVYKLLKQKESFTNVDYELFSLLAGQAATAIFGSKLYTESERKLSTIQGFINLLTK